MNYDVIVIGSGVVGSALAHSVAREGLSVAVLDAKSEPPNSYRHLSINKKSRQFLEQIEVWQNIKNSAFPYDQIKVWDQEGTGFIDFDATEAGLSNLGYIVREGDIQKALIDSFKKSDIQAFWDHSLEGINITDDRIICETNKESFEGKIIIGSDGVNSQVRNLSKISSRSWSYNQTAIVANFESSAKDNCIRQTFTSIGPLALLPMNSKEMTMIWSIDDEYAYKFLAMTDLEFTSEVKKYFGEHIEDLKLSSKRQNFPLQHLSAKTFAKNRVFLVGDSAHHIHPLAGLGLNAGIGDVDCLSELIKSNGLDQINKITSSYNRSRIPVNLGLAASMEAFKRGFGQKNIWVRLLRNSAFNITNELTPLKKKFMKLATEL